MSFVVILACLAVQWFLNLSSTMYEFHWAGHYVQWMRHQFSKLMQGHGLFAVLILLLPIVIVVSLIFTLVYHLLGHVGYLILSLLLLWYCVDVVILRQAPAVTVSTTDLFIKSYQKIFAPLLWYFVCGPVGLTLYVSVAILRAQLPEQRYFVMTQGVLDWVPIRLVGLTFALAGNFGAVFKLWMSDLLRGIPDTQNQVVIFGDAALSTDPDALGLIRRTLLIWLVLMALITLGRWFG